MSANGISTLSTKEAKQKAKLALAQLKRQGYLLAADGSVISGPDTSANYYRDNNVYDITRLPLPYGYTDDQTVNPLQDSRPWLPYDAGAYRTTYSGYWNGNPAWFLTATATATLVAGNFTIPSESTTTSELYLSYIKPDYTGTWTFSMQSDDKAMIWIGDLAVSGYTASNPLISSNVNTVTGTIDLIAGHFYPLLLMFGNNAGPGILNLTYAHTGQSATNDYTGKLYYNRTTNGL